MRTDNDDTLRKVLYSDHNGPLKRSVSYKISFGFSARRAGVSQALLMNKLRVYINLLIVIQIGFLNRRLEVMRLASAFVADTDGNRFGTSIVPPWFHRR